MTERAIDREKILNPMEPDCSAMAGVAKEDFNESDDDNDFYSAEEASSDDDLLCERASYSSELHSCTTDLDSVVEVTVSLGPCLGARKHQQKKASTRACFHHQPNDAQSARFVLKDFHVKDSSNVFTSQLSLQDVASLLKQTLKEVENRIDQDEPTRSFAAGKSKRIQSTAATTKTKNRHVSKNYHPLNLHKRYEASMCRRTFTKCLRGSPRKVVHPPPFTWVETGWTFVGVFITLLLLFSFNGILKDVFKDDENPDSVSTDFRGIVMGPFGALLTLQYGVTSAPLGQPRNILYGQLSSLLIAFGIGSIEILPVWARQTLAAVLAISFMVRCGITHPPAGAAALLVSGEKTTLLSMAATLLANVLAIGSATILNNMSIERQYPMTWRLDWPELGDIFQDIGLGLRRCCIKMVWDDGDNGGDQWSDVVTTMPNTPTDTPLLSAVRPSSSSLRRTQRYSYSVLQWQSLQRANSSFGSWLSFRSSSEPSSQSLLLEQDMAATERADNDNGVKEAVYGSVGLPI